MYAYIFAYASIKNKYIWLVDTFMQRGQTKLYILVQQWCQQTLFVYNQLNINIIPRYLKLWILHMVHLSKRCCYSNKWLWVSLNFADVLNIEKYKLFSFFLFLGQKLTIVEQSCTLQGHYLLTSCHVLTAKYSNYLLSYSAFFWHNLLYKYSTQYVSWNNSYVFFDITIVQLWVW